MNPKHIAKLLVYLEHKYNANAKRGDSPIYSTFGNFLPFNQSEHRSNDKIPVWAVVRVQHTLSCIPAYSHVNLYLNLYTE